MEMMANSRENVKKFPQIAEAFDAYGKRRGPATAGTFPVGLGPMRVIPIERAIEGETRKASYEEVSMYLNENEIFSVSDYHSNMPVRHLPNYRIASTTNYNSAHW